MTPPFWRPVWLALVPRLTLIGIVALAAWIAGGPAWAGAAAAVGLFVVVALQTRQLVALAVWLRDPDGNSFPDAGGVWGEVFLRLSRHLREDAKVLRTAEGELRSFKEAIEALPEGIVLLDANQQILWCNRAAGAHLGIDPVGDLGAILSQLVRAPGFAEYLSGTPAERPFTIQTAGPRTRIYALHVVPFGDHQRILVSTDVTGARRTESMRSDFVANVSHELRTPLTVVSGFLEHFSDAAQMTQEQQRHFARLMSDQTGRMLNLVDDLLTLSRLEADDVPQTESRIDMDEMLDQLRDTALGLSAGRHRIVVEGDGPALRGDPKELHSAFANLVSNAIRYTPEGGQIRIRWSAGDGSGRFSVEDSGVGIPAEHLPRLTERFYRVDRGRSRDSGGTGLGLAIVKHVLLRHQARLGIRSAPGSGSCFEAEFPAWRLDGAPAASPNTMTTH